MGIWLVVNNGRGLNLFAKVYKSATNYKIDANRIGTWGASAGRNVAASLALKFASGATERATIRLVSLVGATSDCTPKSRNFVQPTAIPRKKSRNEELLADVPPLPERVSTEVVQLYST